MKRIYPYIALAAVVLLSLMPPINFFILNPVGDRWFYMVLIAGFLGFYTLYIKTHWFLKVFAIGAFLNCFFAASPYMAFTAYVSTVLVCYFFILCTKIDDWSPIFKALQIVVVLNIVLIFMQSIGKDTLLNFGLYRDIVTFGTVGQHMQMSSFATVVSAFLILYNPLNFIFPLITAGFCHSTWTYVSVGVGLFLYLYPKDKKLGRYALILMLFLFIIFSIKEQKFIANFASSGRMTVWVKSIELTNKRPLTGYGIGTYKELYHPLSASYNIPYKTAHNWVIQLLFETGYIFTGFVLLMLVRVFYLLWRVKAYSVVAGLAMILTDMLVHFPERQVQCVLIIVCFLAIAYSTISSKRKR